MYNKNISILQPKTNDRLGFSLLKFMNQVPIGNWLWRIVEANDLRAKVITAKYVVSRNGWDFLFLVIPTQAFGGVFLP